MCTESLKGNPKATDILVKYYGNSINNYGELYPPEIRSQEGHAAANEAIGLIKDIMTSKFTQKMFEEITFFE